MYMYMLSCITFSSVSFNFPTMLATAISLMLTIKTQFIVDISLHPFFLTAEQLLAHIYGNTVRFIASTLQKYSEQP